MPEEKPRPNFSNVQSGGSSTAPAAPPPGAAPSPPPKPAAAAPAPRTYTVAAGDSLSKIAKKLYGDANQWNRIFEANRDTIKNPDLIHPGQVLKIPDVESKGGDIMARTLRTCSPTPLNVLAFCLVATLFGACSKPEEAPKPAPQAAAPQAQPPFHVIRVDLGNAVGADKRVVAPSVTFKPSDTIYASILSEGVAPSAALAVRWTFEDGQVVNESTQTIAPNGPAATEFHIAKADGWPAGKY